MSKKILELAVKRVEDIEIQREAIDNCQNILSDLKRYGVDALSIKSPDGLSSISYLKDCCLDPGQKELIAQLFTSVLNSRMTDAENELKKLLDVEDVEQEPRPRRSRQPRPEF
ncbi:MAG: hypothetical protein RHS_6049 [Robinsoniella sp. RHS]|uniref:hypothetical protein n=1 Tax=Robinsoniella sp. RHS TaxID=1504536 RepID=UPI0006497142|nr:MAG: hypothetical protein RHS_6049 [Robinsoniella sp. RHS]